MLNVLVELHYKGNTFIIDSMPWPVCHQYEPVVARKSEDGTTAATVRLKARNSLAGGCI